MFGGTLRRCASASANEQCAGRDCRCGQGRVGRRRPRCHRRGVKPGADRKNAMRSLATARGNTRSSILRPGTYQVSFTLAGFKTVRRDGILLEGNFTPPSQRGATGRLGRRDDYRHRRSPPLTSSTTRGLCREPRRARRHSRRPSRNTPARALLIPGTTVTPFVLGQYNMSGARLGHRRHGDRHRRHARQQPVRQRAVQRLLHE